jgi:phosphoserine phosphatase
MKGKEIKLVFFDMDGVLFDSPGYEENSTWAILFHDLGISYENEKLKEKFLKGIFSTYMEWSEEACKVLKRYGLTRGKFMETINKRPLMNGARETINELKRRGYKTGGITGSFEALALRAKEELDLDYAIGHCRLIFDDFGNLKDWVLLPCDFEDKKDFSTFKKVGLSIAFNATKEEVRKSAKVVIDKKDLREILKYLR